MRRSPGQAAIDPALDAFSCGKLTRLLACAIVVKAEVHCIRSPSSVAIHFRTIGGFCATYGRELSCVSIREMVPHLAASRGGVVHTSGVKSITFLVSGRRGPARAASRAYPGTRATERPCRRGCAPSIARDRPADRTNTWKTRRQPRNRLVG